MKQRTRNIPVYFMVSNEEARLIDIKMDQLGTKNKGGYLRKMAIDGYVIRKDYSELKALTGELGKIGSNINQIAKRANESHNINQTEVCSVREKLNDINKLLRRVLERAI